MESLSRWLCSFKADTVRIQLHTQTVTCGERVLLCSINLTNPTSKFTDYHENKTTALYSNRKAEVLDCKFNIRKINSRTLDVYCFAKRAGDATVRLDLGKWYQFESAAYYYQDLKITILPSTPKYLKNVQVCCDEKPVDKKHTHEMGTVYYGIRSLLKFQAVDEFGNIIQHERYDVKIGYSEHNVLQNVEWEMRRGTVYAIFWPDMIGEKHMIIQLIHTGSNQVYHFTCQHPINVLHPPCSPSLTLKADIDHEQCCTAGKESMFQVNLLDIFGNPVLQDSNEAYNVDVQAPPSKRAVKQRQEEQLNTRKIKTPKSFAVTVDFKIAGLRKVSVTMNSGSKSSSKDIYVQVLPSAPHHLSDVRFTTIGVIDEDFIPDPTVMYRDQWSILEGTIFDSYDNVVRQLSDDLSISLKLSGDEGEEMEIESKNAEIRNEQFRVQVKTNVAGKHNLSITLTNGSSSHQVYRMKDTEIQVNEAPMYLLGSEFQYPKKCVAGQEIRLKVLPADVFGCPLPADSTSDPITLTAEIPDSTLEPNEHKKTVGFTTMKNESNIVVCVSNSVVLTKAGSRKVIIFDKDNERKELRIQVNSDPSNVHWTFTAPNETAYRREELILRARLCDRFNNDVQIDALKTTPDLTQREGPDGLDYAGKSVEDNRVVIRFNLKQPGKYDLRLVDSNGTNTECSSFSVTVEDAPLDYHASTIEWIPQYGDDQPVFPDDKTFECCLSLKDVVGYDHDGKIETDDIEVRYGNTKVKDIEVFPCANDTGTYNIVVPLKNLVKDDPSPQFWCFVNGRKIENPLILETFETFDKYDDDENCVVQQSTYEFVKIFCRDVTKTDILGNDYCHLNNVKRVCNLCDDPKVHTFQLESIDDDLTYYINDELIRAGDDDQEDYYDHYYAHYGDDYDDLICTVIILPFEEIENKVEKFRDILLHLLRAIYYRKEAFELDKDREKWKEKARNNYKRIQEGDNIDKAYPRVCSQIKEKYAKLMRRYHDAACEEFFQFFNAERGQSEIDLHGLLVVDEKKLRDYERQLRSRGRMSSDEVDKKIQEERDHGNEAIRKLRERLDNYDETKAKKEGEPWLEIIVGSGHHSKVKERQRIRPKVEEYLQGKEWKGRQLTFSRLESSPVNKGALVVTFEEYAGPEPCFGEYYCTKCDNRWRNGQSWIGKWQACYVCYEETGSLEKCYPLKQRARKKQQRHNPKFVSRNQRYVPNHVPELCQACRELGKECQRAS